MFNLLYKELRLAAHPTLYIFALMGALVIIPAYPYSTVFLYGCLAPFITFSYARENNDAYFTALLPIEKRDVVRAKSMLFVVSQLGQLILSVPFALLSARLTPTGNPVGMDANVAYYGFGLMIFAVFDFVFLTQFYKTAYKVGKALVLAMIPATILMIGVEVLANIEGTKWLDSLDPAMLLRQVPILLAGAAIYAACNAAACRVAQRRFEKVDL